MMDMKGLEVAVAIFESYKRAHLALKALQRAHFDMTRVALIGQECRAEEHIVGFLSVGDRALNEALVAVGIPCASVACYETAVLAGQWMLLVHGDGNDIRFGHAILVGFKPSSTYRHVGSAATLMSAHA